MRGKVKQVPQGDTPGEIRGDDKRSYQFSLQDIDGQKTLEAGWTVNFDNRYVAGRYVAKKVQPISQPEEKKKTKKVKPASQAEKSKRQDTAPSPSPSPEATEGFVNPYNFVPLWGKVNRDAPASHEYFINNSGRIMCKLKLKTPFFTPHPERRFRLPEEASDKTKIPKWIANDEKARKKWQDMINLGAEKDHEMLGLLKDENGKPFVPGSSLKGVFRSVAEALSNSCMSIIDVQWKALGTGKVDGVDLILSRQKDFLTCHNIHKLCPSCRIFGWVHPNPENRKQDIARKGFAHFTTAFWPHNQTPKTQWVTLKPLAQPRPTCWQFYLCAENLGMGKDGYNDPNAKIRGRKFYWHQPSATSETVKDERKTNKGGDRPPDNQNKTAELLLPETEEGGEAIFTFSVDFENLSNADLGLLLLTLQPSLLGAGNGISSELYHHFGMGKPLGLGSAEVEIDSLTLIDRAKRYQSLTESGKQVADSSKITELIDAFIDGALEAQSQSVSEVSREEKRRRFSNMNHIKALLIMLDWKNAPKKEEIHYPPGDENPRKKEYWEAFRWFSHPNQRGEKIKDMLHSPEEIQVGERQDGYPPRNRASRGPGGNRGRTRRRGR